MDINWLRDFICLGRTLNFTRAAEERNITQSAFSRRIKSLETWIGVPLIDRASYPVRLSEAGYQFLPVAQATVSELTGARQALREQARGNATFQRFAALHAISVNFLQTKIAEFERQHPDVRTRVISDSLTACCQLLNEGGCEFLLYYRHQDVAPILDETRFVRKDICEERLIPVAQHAAAARYGWALPGSEGRGVPYLSYDPNTFLGTVVDQTIGNRRTALNLRYMDALAEALKRRTLSGAGIAWLPEFSIGEELATGELVRMGGREWTATMTISLFCSPERLDDVGRMIWDRF
ncbi:MAG: LysR substrate-binding domain-containing protein [Pseudomonadota bacterium]|uniref:LysR substrate-binding domain-containing protein n=1 Tax=Roseovarius TaxID=74030 RepID=UPI0022A828F5|nr:LysR substrate-binding domain-containing protein [Roseovarius sp. EGI FJ00037]MCZ0814231.1 LysR substrate-binding domain-containing protein [Roseovarius sp. EGI FJ00037]